MVYGKWSVKMILRLFAAALFVSGCDQSTQVDQPLPSPTFGQSKLTGQVKFLGKPRPLKLLDNKSCHASATPIPDETLVVNADQQLTGAIVYLKDAPPSDGHEQPIVELDQQNCRYLPHVVTVQVGQTLRIRNSDPVFHNSHFVSQQNGSLNIGLSRAGDYKDIQFKAPEFIHIRCDVHPWMGAQVGVISSPFFSVTDAGGSFSIGRIVPGRYTVVVHHALLGDLEQVIEITGSQTTLDFNYAPPAD